MGITFSELLIGKSRHDFGKKSEVDIKFTNHVSVPKYMSFDVSFPAIHGWFSAIISTEYDIYHVRRMVVPKPDRKNALQGEVNSDNKGR